MQFLHKLIFVGLWASFGNCNLCSPLSYRIGVKVNCEHPITKESINCKTEKTPAGTIAYYKCEDYYVENEDNVGGKIKCNNNGEWSPRNGLHAFSCRIDCGKSGQITKWPWHATIFHQSSELDSFKYCCGGTLINPFNKGFVIVTTPGCLPESSKLKSANIKIALGLTSTEYIRNVESNYAKVYSIRKLATNVPLDVTILDLDSDVILDETIMPACFINNPSLEHGDWNEAKGQLVGFGRAQSEDSLRGVNLFQKPCSNSISRKQTNFCAGLGNKLIGDSVCTGDIGGGLFAGAGNGDLKRYHIQGVLTDRDVGAVLSDDCSRSGVFTNVSHLTQWIRQTVEKFNEDESTNGRPQIETTTPFGLSFQRETVAPTRRIQQHPKPIPGQNGHGQIPEVATERPLPIRVNAQRPRPHTTTTESSSINPTDFQQAGVDWHNVYRRKHGVPEITLSAKLNREAQDEADQWIQNHRFVFQGITNWFGSTGANFDSTEAVKESIKDWYKTFGGYDWNQPSSLPFTHIVWKSTSQIGVGVARKGEDQVVVVKYLRPMYFEHERDKAFKENVLSPIS